MGAMLTCFQKKNDSKDCHKNILSNPTKIVVITPYLPIISYNEFWTLLSQVMSASICSHTTPMLSLRRHLRVTCQAGQLHHIPVANRACLRTHLKCCRVGATAWNLTLFLEAMKKWHENRWCTKYTKLPINIIQHPLTTHAMFSYPFSWFFPGLGACMFSSRSRLETKGWGPLNFHEVGGGCQNVEGHNPTTEGLKAPYKMVLKSSWKKKLKTIL